MRIGHQPPAGAGSLPFEAWSTMAQRFCAGTRVTEGTDPLAGGLVLNVRDPVEADPLLEVEWDETGASEWVRSHYLYQAEFPRSYCMYVWHVSEILWRRGGQSWLPELEPRVEFGWHMRVWPVAAARQLLAEMGRR